MAICDTALSNSSTKASILLQVTTPCKQGVRKTIAVQWFFQMRRLRRYAIVAERMGFEPMVGCPTRHFQCRTLRPLGHLSIYIYSVFMQYHSISSAAPYDHSDSSPFVYQYRLCK